MSFPSLDTKLEPNAQKQATALAPRIFTAEAAIVALILLLSFILFASQNPSSVLPRTTLYFDAAHYLESCKRLYETCGTAFAGRLSKAELDSLAFYLMLDGPVLPGAGVILFSLLHKAPALSQWQSLVYMQCFFQAVSTGFVYLLGQSLFQKRWVSIVAACAWATYAPTISSCNTYLTEPLACALSLGLIYFLSGLNFGGGSRIANFKSLAAGMFLGLLCLLKPALAPASGLAFLFSIVCAIRAQKLPGQEGSKSRIVRVSLAILGLAVVFLPWLAFGYAARGTVTLLPSRRPVYNITTGCNVEGDGWGCYPTHPVAQAYDDNEQAMPVMLSMIAQHPEQIANLSLRKITRLWNLPWNDYRYKILGLTFKLQALWQLVLVFAGFSGLALLAAACFTSSLKTVQKVTIASMLLIIAGHLIYIPFEGISRYGFTSMPFIILSFAFLLEKFSTARKAKFRACAVFVIAVALLELTCKLDLVPFILYAIKNTDAAIFIAASLKPILVFLAGLSIYKLSDLAPGDKAGRKVLAALIGSFVVLSAAIAGAFAMSDRETQSWQCTLKGSDSLERSVNIQDLSLHKPEWALLVLDGDQHLAEAKFQVNGQILPEHTQALYQFYTEKYELEDWLSQFSSLIRRDPESIRKWRAVAVPLAMLKEGQNKLMVCAGGTTPVTIYGDYKRKRADNVRMLPSANEVSPGKFFNDSEESFDSRIVQTTYSVISASSNVLQHGGQVSEKDLSASPGIQSGDYRVFLFLAYPHKNPPNTGSIPVLNKVVSPLKTENSKTNSLQLNPNGNQISLPIPASCLTGTHLRVNINGIVQSSSKTPFALAGVVNQGGRFIASVLPGTPKMVETSPEWKEFSVASELPSVTLQGNNPTLRLEFKCSGTDVNLKDLQLELEGINKPQFKGHSIKVF